MKVTEWFGSDVKPTIVGWYERYYVNCPGLPNDYWDGTEWRISGVCTDQHFDGADQYLPWRGLAEDPNAGGQNG